MPTFTFILEKPWQTAHVAISAAFAGSTPDTDHLVGTDSTSRQIGCLLPAPCPCPLTAISHTGLPCALPAMSHRAISTADLVK